MNELDQKINTHFPGLVVRKDLVKTVKGNAIVPSYVLEYLLGQYCATSDEPTIQTGIETVKEILAKHYVHRNEAGLDRSNIKEKGRYKVIDKIIMDDWYSFFASEFFSCFTTELDKLSVNEVLRNLRHNRALQVRYKGTEHDIALVAYDTQTNEFILKEADQFSPVPEDKLVELFEPKAFAYGAIRPEEFRRY